MALREKLLGARPIVDRVDNGGGSSLRSAPSRRRETTRWLRRRGNSFVRRYIGARLYRPFYIGSLSLSFYDLALAKGTTIFDHLLPSFTIFFSTPYLYLAEFERTLLPPLLPPLLPEMMPLLPRYCARLPLSFVPYSSFAFIFLPWKRQSLSKKLAPCFLSTFCSRKREVNSDEKEVKEKRKGGGFYRSIAGAEQRLSLLQAVPGVKSSSRKVVCVFGTKRVSYAVSGIIGRVLA